MVTITLLDVDRLSLQDARVLAIIMASYGVQFVAIIHNGSMHIRCDAGLVEPFLATIARDVVSTGTTDAFALVA